MITVRAKKNETVDAICWRHYGRTAGVTERVYEANPGLSELGATLPTGHPVKLPEIEAQAEQAGTVNLWD